MAKKRNTVFAVAALLAAVFLAGAARPDLYFLIKKNFTIFSEVYREVAINYVDEVDPEKLMRRGINEMLTSLDPYTVFIDEADKQNIDITTQGGYGGVGVNVGMRGDEMVVISPVEGYSAHQQGIRAGDVITAVDGISVHKRTPEEVQQIMTGEPGSTVTMTISRYGINRQLTFELERERIEITNVDYAGFIDEANSIGYISLNRFAQNAGAEVQQAYEDLRQQGELMGLVIDVRNNPGGLLNEAVNIVDLFIAPGQEVVETRGRTPDKNRVFKTSRPAAAPDLLLVVLQNSGSASASEIVAGALQDLDRAVVMGNRSFGKGLVQIVQPLSYNTALKITTGRYYIPSGRSIQAITYSRDEENSAVKKPDSLRRAFTTRNGRTVYDGEGITPDVSSDDKPPSALETALLQQKKIFSFANRYVSQHDSYSHEALPANVYSEFKTFLEQDDFTYTMAVAGYLQEAEQSLRRQGMASSEVTAQITTLRNAINREKSGLLDKQALRLQQLIHLELVRRYRGEESRRAASLGLDTLVEQARSIIMNTERYQSILSGAG